MQASQVMVLFISRMQKQTQSIALNHPNLSKNQEFYSVCLSVVMQGKY